jgi:hypothetical protein
MTTLMMSKPTVFKISTFLAIKNGPTYLSYLLKIVPKNIISTMTQLFLGQSMSLSSAGYRFCQIEKCEILVTSLAMAA